MSTWAALAGMIGFRGVIESAKASPRELARIEPHFEKKDSRVAPLSVISGAGNPVYQRRTQQQYALEGYQQNIIVYASVRMVAEAVASIPLGLFNGDTEIDTHPLLDLLASPNPFEDGVSFATKYISDLCIYGNFYLERVDNVVGGRTPREIYRWRPDRTTVVPNARGYPGAYEYSVAGSTRYRLEVAPPDNVPMLHGYTYNPIDDWYGMSPLDPAGWAVDSHASASKFNTNLMRNSAVPSGALTVIPDPKTGDSSLTGEQRTALQEDLDRKFSGAKNAGRPILLEGGLDWKSFSMTMAEMQFTEVTNNAAREIALAFGVPPPLLGIQGDNTYSNYQEARRAFWVNTAIPLAGKRARLLTGWLCPSYGKGLKLQPNTDNLDALSEERAQQWDRIEKSTSLTLNEKREANGYDDYGADGDVILVSSTMVPLETAVAPPEPAPAAVDENGDPIVDPNADPAADPVNPKDPAVD